MAKSKQAHAFMTNAQRNTGILYLLFTVFALPVLLRYLNGLLRVPLGAAWLNFIYYSINFLSLVGIFRSFLLRSLTYAGKHVWAVLGYSILGFFAYCAANFGLSYVIRLFDPSFSNVNDSTIMQQLSGNFWIMAIGTVLLVPTAEELLYRGIVFGSLKQKYPVAAYIVSMLVFAAVHVMGYIGTVSPATLLLCLIQYLPAGLTLAWCYDRSKCIYVPILIHTAVNTMGLLAMR